MFRPLSLFVALYLFWMLLSGFFTAFLLAAGAASALVVVMLARRMDVVDGEGHPVERGALVLRYWPWLMKEVVKSAWDVSRIIVHPRLPITPTIVRFAPSQRTVVGLVIHANSITLTPSTITIEATRDEFVVHGLTRAGAEACVASAMDRRITACEPRR